jgi:hypothetical protein
MTRSEQLHLTATCQRCGAPLPALEQIAARSARARRLILDRKMAIPQVALDDLAAVASQLRCLALLCCGPEAR